VGPQRIQDLPLLFGESATATVERDADDEARVGKDERYLVLRTKMS